MTFATPVIVIALLGWGLFFVHGRRHPAVGTRAFRVGTWFYLAALFVTLLVEIIVGGLSLTDRLIRGDESNVILFGLAVVYLLDFLSACFLFTALYRVHFLVPAAIDVSLRQCQRVRDLIADVITHNTESPTWRTFLSYSFGDRDLDQIRRRCLAIDEQFRSYEFRGYLSEEGIDKLRRVFEDLDAPTGE